MIIGNGLLAKAFYEYYLQNDELIIFASGVSNSQETSVDKFLREETLLRNALNLNKKIIYFSTCSIEDITARKSPYVLHKIKMECLIKEISKNYMIFRLPQLIGKAGNPNTLINFLYKKILNDEELIIQEFARRNIIDVEHVAKIIKFILDKGCVNQTINIANKNSISVSEIVNILENLLVKKAICKLIAEGSSYCIEAKLSNEVAQALGITFDDSYVSTAIRKYYSIH